MATAERRAANIASLNATKAAGGVIPASNVVQPKANQSPVAAPIQQSPIGGAVQADGTITQTGMTPQTISGVQPLKIPAATVPTTAAGILGTADAVKTYATEQQRLDAEAEKARQAVSADKASLTDLMNQIVGIQSGSLNAQEEAGIPLKAERVSQLTSQLEGLQRKQANQIRALEGTALTDAQKSAKIQEINRQAAFEQADVALLQSAANRDLATATSILDQKTKLQLEPLKTQLDFLKVFYEDNKDALTTADKNALDARIKTEQRALDKADALEAAKNKYIASAISQGAPGSIVSAISNAKSEIEATTAAGRYAGDILDREIKLAQLDKLYAETAAKNAEGKVLTDVNGKVVLKPEEASKVNKELVSNDSYKALVKAGDSLTYLGTFEELFNENGATSGFYSPIENAEMKSAYNAAILNLKEFFNLGVLNGPDEAILKGVLPDPTGKRGVDVFAAGATRNGLANLKKSIDTTLDSRYNDLAAQYQDYSPESVGSLKEVQRNYIKNKAQVNENVAQLLRDNPDMEYADIISIINGQ